MGGAHFFVDGVKDVGTERRSKDTEVSGSRREERRIVVY